MKVSGKENHGVGLARQGRRRGGLGQSSWERWEERCLLEVKRLG